MVSSKSLLQVILHDSFTALYKGSQPLLIRIINRHIGSLLPQSTDRMPTHLAGSTKDENLSALEPPRNATQGFDVSSRRRLRVVDHLLQRQIECDKPLIVGAEYDVGPSFNNFCQSGDVG